MLKRPSYTVWCWMADAVWRLHTGSFTQLWCDWITIYTPFLLTQHYDAEEIKWSDYESAFYVLVTSRSPGLPEVQHMNVLRKVSVDEGTASLCFSYLNSFVFWCLQNPTFLEICEFIFSLLQGVSLPSYSMKPKLKAQLFFLPACV